MTNVRITGWRDGFKKVSFGNLLREKGMMTLAQAKHAVDDVLEGRDVVIDVPSPFASEFVAEALALGAVCEVQDES